MIWSFRGSYGGEELPEIICGGTIRFENESAPEPTPEPEPVYASMAGVIRYVGEEAATFIMKNKLCYEEFYAHYVPDFEY